MKVHLSRIAEGPSRHHLRLRAEALPRLAERLIEGSGEIEADVHLRMLAEAVEVTGRLRESLDACCDLCLEATHVALDDEFVALQAPARMLADLPDDLRLSEGELDVDFFEGDDIDLIDLVEEQALLLLPPAILCREDCAGICAGCGENLNHGECICVEQNDDNPFAGMKALLDNPST